MSGVAFDIGKLSEVKGLDTDEAVRGLGGQDAYNEGLAIFLKEYEGYLRSYTPLVVAHSDDVRREFTEDTERLKEKLGKLGMSDLTLDLTHLAEAAAAKDAAVISDGITFFQAKIGIIAKALNSAILQEPHTPAVFSKPLSNRKPLILAVDDKPEILAAISAALEEDYKVICVTDAMVALKAIEVHTPDLFLLDIEMPDINGFELASTIRNNENHKQTPIIFLTGKKAREDVQKAITVGGNDYLLKPVNKEVMLDKIKRYFQ